MADVTHPGGAAPAAPPVAAPAAAPETSQQRMRVGDMSGLHHTPAPAVAEREQARRFGEIDSGIENLDARSQAMTVPDPDQMQLDGEQPLETQIMVDGQEVTWEQYQALQAKWDQDDLHEELQQKFVTATIDGQRYRIPVSEAVQGYQRARDYSNGMAEVAAGKRENDRQRQGFLNVLRDMDQGESFVRMVRALGKEDGFEAAAKLFAIQWAKEQKMTPEARQAHARLREIERKAYQLEQRNKQLEQAMTQQAPPPDQRQQYIYNQLAQMIPIASQRVGLPDSLAARQAFELHWQKMLPTLGQNELTTDFVIQVMRAAKEEVDVMLGASNAELAARQPKVPPVTRLPGAAPPAGSPQANGQPKRMRIGEMNRELTRQPNR